MKQRLALLLTIGSLLVIAEEFHLYGQLALFIIAGTIPFTTISLPPMVIFVAIIIISLVLLTMGTLSMTHHILEHTHRSKVAKKQHPQISLRTYLMPVVRRLTQKHI